MAQLKWDPKKMCRLPLTTKHIFSDNRSHGGPGGLCLSIDIKLWVYKLWIYNWGLMNFSSIIQL